MNHDLLATVRSAAHRLLADLDDGARATGDWHDADLGERLVREALDCCMAKLGSTDLVGRDNQIASNEFWRNAGDWLRRGPLQLHARSKPRGYAGDTDMLAAIFHDTVSNDPLGRAFDRYFQALDAPRAVAGRIRYAASAIVEHWKQRQRTDYRIVCVGSGYPVELSLAANALPVQGRESLSIALLDLDERALDDAAAMLTAGTDSPLEPSQVETVRDNLFRLARRSEVPALAPGADFLICLGLFDYLVDEDARDLLELFYRSLRPSGSLIIGNFAPHCQARTYMEWIGAWYLIYRTREDFTALGHAAGIPAPHFRIDAEPTGVDLLLRAERPLR